MKSTKINEKKYRGYLIKPAVTGFRVYRKEYYIAEYPTLQTAMVRIDRVVDKFENRDKSRNIPTAAKGQIELF